MSAQLLAQLASAAGAVTAIAVNALWEDALLVVCVWLLLRAWPGLNAATRYIVWSATLIATVVVPVATTLPFLVPSSPATAVQRHGGEGAHAHGDARPHRRPVPPQSKAAERLSQPAQRLTVKTPAQSAPVAAASRTFPHDAAASPRTRRPRVWALLALVRVRAAGDRARAARGAQARRAAACRSNTATRWPRWTARQQRLARSALVRQRRHRRAGRGRTLRFDDPDSARAARAFVARGSRSDQPARTRALASCRRLEQRLAARRHRAVRVESGACCSSASNSISNARSRATIGCSALTGSVRPYALCLTKMAETASWPYVRCPRRAYSPRANTSRCASSGCSAPAATPPRTCRSGRRRLPSPSSARSRFAMQLVAPSVAASTEIPSGAQSKRLIQYVEFSPNARRLPHARRPPAPLRRRPSKSPSNTN